VSLGKQDRAGSAMSTKQMAYAAVAGRRLTVHIPGCPPLFGYLVGMDDFHWLVAEIHEGRPQPQVSTHLVHKSAPRIRIDHEASLSDESTAAQALVNEIGGSFFAHCQDKILARPALSK